MARPSLSLWLDGATSSREGYLVWTPHPCGLAYGQEKAGGTAGNPACLSRRFSMSAASMRTSGAGAVVSVSVLPSSL
jgi:hypothetical protein